MTEHRTSAATAARKRKSEERKAGALAERGWVSIPPDHPLIGQVRALLSGDLQMQVRVR